MKELLAIIAARRAEPEAAFALATVVGVTGSSYRRPGARMLIGASGRVAGSVSGGCLEEDVVARGQRAMALGAREVAVYDTSNQEDLVFGSGLGCQGRIEIFIEPLAPGAPWPLADLVQRVLVTRQAATLETATGSGVFTERIVPPLALVIFGAGPDVGPLVRIARELGHHITVVDRRPAISRVSFPEADQFFCARPGQLGERVRFDGETAVVIMNHHYETDREALEFVLPHHVAYIGMLGPRKRTDRILDELAKRGAEFMAEELASLHAPAGLDLGSESPEQIALSILAEMHACLSGRSAGKLRSRSAPINAR